MIQQLPNFDPTSSSSVVSYSFNVLPISEIIWRTMEVQELQKQNLKSTTLFKKKHWQLPGNMLYANIYISVKCIYIYSTHYQSHKGNVSIFNRFHLDRGSRYCDWLRARGPSRLRSSPGGGKIFLVFTSSRSVPGPTQSPIQ
jgi:hypothetical protein